MAAAAFPGGIGVVVGGFFFEGEHAVGLAGAGGELNVGVPRGVVFGVAGEEAFEELEGDIAVAGVGGVLCEGVADGVIEGELGLFEGVVDFAGVDEGRDVEAAGVLEVVVVRARIGNGWRGVVGGGGGCGLVEFFVEGEVEVGVVGGGDEFPVGDGEGVDLFECDLFEDFFGGRAGVEVERGAGEECFFGEFAGFGFAGDVEEVGDFDAGVAVAAGDGEGAFEGFELERGVGVDGEISGDELVVVGRAGAGAEESGEEAGLAGEGGGGGFEEVALAGRIGGEDAAEEFPAELAGFGVAGAGRAFLKGVFDGFPALGRGEEGEEARGGVGGFIIVGGSGGELGDFVEECEPGGGGGVGGHGGELGFVGVEFVGEGAARELGGGRSGGGALDFGDDAVGALEVGGPAGAGGGEGKDGGEQRSEGV